MDTAKPQPSLRGFVAWAFLKYVEKRGVSQAEGAAKIIEAWFDDHYAELAERYDISQALYDEARRGRGDESQGGSSA